ncbi:hypothetical protein BGZ76_005169 [Entomortierella beljakovae]|nr:hypothetical protein BGZ76_005169 [Entomortierella beljakovae]
MASSSSTLRSRSTVTSTMVSTTQTSSSNQQSYGSTSSGIFSIKPADETPDKQSVKSKRVDQKESIRKLLTFEEIPEWMQDNPAILTGYRREAFSYKKCIDTLWFLHNESVNIWTHLLGSFACIVGSPFVYFYYIGVMDTINWADITVFYLFMAGAIICLSLSALFHCFHCHSEPVSKHWNRCDYVGIVFLIAGSFYPAIYYGFYCSKSLQILYTTMITTIGLAVLYVAVKPKFRGHQYRWIRSGLFLAMGLSGIFPVFHSVFLYGLPLAQKAVSFNYSAAMGAFYVFGTLLYGSRSPESIFPGKFDCIGSSHQIFHVCVLFGVLSHFLGVTKAMAFWHDANHDCAIPLSEMISAY